VADSNIARTETPDGSDEQLAVAKLRSEPLESLEPGPESCWAQLVLLENGSGAPDVCLRSGSNTT
jgi:hypothetical protein